MIQKAAAAGPVELLPGWRLVIQFVAGAHWRGDLYNPLGIPECTWIGKVTGDDLIESASGYLDTLKRPEEASALRRHWKAIR